MGRLLFVPKKDGTKRVVQDLRDVNLRTYPERYPPPPDRSSLGRSSGPSLLLHTGSEGGLLQIELDEASRDLTAFGTTLGQMRWRRMPMGLTGASAKWQKLINGAIRSVLGKGVVAYVDDLLIYTKDFNHHIEIMHRILDLIRDANIMFSAKKATLCHGTGVEYVGWILGEDGVRPDLRKPRPSASWAKRS